jgi:hypothetical protein
MSPSSPVRSRQQRRPSPPPQVESDKPPRRDSVVKSILLVVAAVSVIATSDYLAYLIGRKQVTYEELSRQVDRLVKLVDEKKGEEEHSVTTLKERQERLEQNESVLNGLTTGTVNGKTTAVAEPTFAPKPIIVPQIVDTIAPSPPSHEVRLQPPEQSPAPAAKSREIRGVGHQHASRRQRVPPAPAETGWGAAKSSFAEQPGQSAAVPTPDKGLSNQ